MIKNKIFNKKLLFVICIILLFLSMGGLLYKNQDIFSDKGTGKNTRDNDGMVTKKDTDETGISNKCETKKLTDYNSIYGDVLFNVKSKNYAFHVSKKMKDKTNVDILVLNGENIVDKFDYEDVGGIHFSENMDRYIYAGKKDGKWFLVKDGKKLDNSDQYSFNFGYDKSFGVVFSKNGDFVLHTASNSEGIFYAINGEKKSEIYPFDKLPKVSYSDNLGMIVYKKNEKVDKTNSSWKYYYDYYINGEKIGGNRLIEEFVLSPDGQAYMYTTKIGNNYFLYKNDKRIGIYQKIERLSFVKDSSNYMYLATGKGKSFFVKNGLEGTKYDQIRGLKYSKDRTKYSFVGINKNGKKVVVLNGKEGSAYDDILDTWNLSVDIYVDYSSDFTNSAYIAKKGDAYHVVLNGVEGSPYSEIEDMIFDKNTNDIVYVGNKGNDLGEFLVVNDKELYKIEEDSKIVYQGYVLKKPYSVGSIYNLNGVNEELFEVQNEYNYIGLNKELYDLAVNYEKYDYGYISDDRKTTIFLGKKNGTYFLVRNGEELIETKNFVAGIYPIDNGKSFIYDEYGDDFNSKYLVECE